EKDENEAELDVREHRGNPGGLCRSGGRSGSGSALTRGGGIRGGRGRGTGASGISTLDLGGERTEIDHSDGCFNELFCNPCDDEADEEYKDRANDVGQILHDRLQEPLDGGEDA